MSIVGQMLLMVTASEIKVSITIMLFIVIMYAIQMHSDNKFLGFHYCATTGALRGRDVFSEQ